MFNWKKNSAIMAEQILVEIAKMQEAIPEGFREIHNDSLIDLPWADEQFATCEIDFPWSYEDMGFNGFQSVQEYRIHCPYRQMPFSAVLANCAEISRIMKRDSHMYLWVTKDFVAHGMIALAAMGYELKNIIVWIKTTRAGKPTYGMGHWYRNGHEMILFGCRGKSQRPAEATVTPNYFLAPKPPAKRGEYTKHSRKPEEAYEMIRRNSPGPRVSIFQRGSREGFYCWGDEADLDFVPANPKEQLDPVSPGLSIGVDGEKDLASVLIPVERVREFADWFKVNCALGAEEIEARDLLANDDQIADSISLNISEEIRAIPDVDSATCESYLRSVEKYGKERADRVWADMFEKGQLDLSLEEVIIKSSRETT